MFRKKQVKIPYDPWSCDPQYMRPVIKCSICTGEQSAGFKDIRTGKFEEVMLIKSGKDLEAFQKMYGLSEVPKEY